MSTPQPDKPNLGARHRFLLRLERFSRQRYGLVFLGALVLALLGAVLGSRLSIESDILALIPEGNRQVDTFKEAVEDFGAVSYLLVLLEAGEEQGPDELEDFADLFASSLAEQEELIDRIEYRLEPDADVLELFFENALLFLPPQQLPELAEMLSDEAIAGKMHENRLLVASPMGEFTADLMQQDPLGLMPLFLNRLFGNRRGIHVDMSDGYYLSRDGRKLIMLVKPTGAWQDMSFNELLLATSKQIESEVRQELDESEHAGTGIGVRYSGHYAIAVDEAKLIRQDVSRNLLVSLIAVSALYFICYRRFAALLYSSVPLLVGQAMTFGLAFGVLGSLNAASSAFTALLMGLGTDFVIVMYARYVEERRLGRTLGEATELMVGETGLGVFTGAITSAGTFYAMCISDFRGLRDLGFLIGSGILLCAITIVFLVPAMIKWNEGVRKRKVESLKKLHVQSFLLEHLITFSAQHRVAIIGLTIVLTGICGYLATQIGFDDTVQVLRSNRSQAIKVQDEIAQEFGASLSFMMAISEGKSSEEAIELAQKIESRLGPYLEEGVVSSYDSILGYLPPESQQRELLLALETDTTDAFDPVRVRRSILRAADAQGFREDAFSGFLDRMERFLKPREPINVTDLEERGLGHLVQRYVRRDGDGVRIVSYMTMSDPRWKREPPPGLVADLSGDDSGIVVTGTNVVGVELRRIFSVESRKAVALGLVVVLALLLIDFRSLKLTLVALAQLVCGVVMMLGLMQVFGYRLNYVNAFVATMILGVGIDYSIHLVHRMSLTGGEVDAGLLETGKAVVIAAFTNIAAFGTLALGNYPALRSFGVVATFGSATCLFTALTLVPALMARPRKRP
jgi:predicted RND superfamily exporter protein